MFLILNHIYPNKVYAHPPLAISFFDHHYISLTIRVVDFVDELCGYQLLNFFFDDIILL